MRSTYDLKESRLASETISNISFLLLNRKYGTQIQSVMYKNYLIDSFLSITPRMRLKIWGLNI